MKYKSVNWNLKIDIDEEITDYDLELIEKEISNGNTSGFYTTDCTDYERCKELKIELENKLGREVDCNVEQDDIGELNDLLQIAVDNKDTEIEELIKELLEVGFNN